MNPFGLVGKVNRDITNLVVLLERGKDLEPNYNNQAPESEWPSNKPLRGAEGVNDHSDEIAISGRALDANSQEPISRFLITPGKAYGGNRSVNWEPQHSVKGSNGSYTLYLEKGRSGSVLKLEAEGYLPLVYQLNSLAETNHDFALTKGTGPKGRVLLPNGEAAAGVTVVMLCKGDQASLDGKGDVHTYQKKKQEKITDSEGLFAFAPELEMVSVAAGGPDGFRAVSIDSLAANSNIVLEAYGTIKGILKRPAGPGKGEELDVDFDNSPNESMTHINLLKPRNQ